MSAQSPSGKPNALTHLNTKGEMHMVDISSKASTHRVAVAEARVSLGAEAIKAMKEGNKKGDVLAAARFAGITGAKRTSELIPLCHPLALSHVSIDITEEADGLLIEAKAETTGPTGVEMEALTACTVAALTVYDMCKAASKATRIEDVVLLSKSGGKSGDFHGAV